MKPRAPEPPRRVLLLGGTGAVGSRLARLIGRAPGVELLLVARDLERNLQLVENLEADGFQASAVGVDPIDRMLVYHRPALLIDCSAPFRGRDFSIPRACIAARVPYLDVAEAPDFVLGIRTLNAAAIDAGVPILSGAGMLPCLTLAAAETAVERLDDVTAVRVSVCPGNQEHRGSANFRALIASAGTPFKQRADGAWRDARAWRGVRTVEFPGLGRRRLSPVDTPENQLLLERWPGLRHAVVSGGAELSILHHGLRALAWMRGAGTFAHSARFASIAESIARAFGHFGRDVFGLRIEVEGRVGDHDVRRVWALLARSGDGVWVPAAPVAALARAILDGPVPQPGARVASASLRDILAQLPHCDLDVRTADMDLE